MNEYSKTAKIKSDVDLATLDLYLRSLVRAFRLEDHTDWKIKTEQEGKNTLLTLSCKAKEKEE